MSETKYDGQGPPDDFCKAHNRPYWNECPDCADIAHSKEGASQSPIDEEMPKEIKDYLVSKMRPFHNRISYRAGAIELYQYMTQRREAVDLMEIVPGISPEAIMQIVQLNLTQVRDYEKALFASEQEVKALQSQLSSMIAQKQEEIDQVVENAVAFSKLSVKLTNEL